MNMFNSQHNLRNIILFLLLVLSLHSCLHLQKTEIPPQDDLVFETDYYEFGKVLEGEIIKHTFSFTNKSSVPVKLTKIKTSCGCTTIESVLKEYSSGESGQLEVIIDTKGKHGFMFKTVEVYVDLENGKQKKKELTLIAELTPPPHPKIENVLSITKDAKCKTCHLESGVGLKGGFLYHRVCSQCHGRRGKGASASAFSNKEWLNNVENGFIRRVIIQGLPKNGMPSYVDGVTPPLSDEQVDSLVDYIRSLGE